MTVEKEKMEEEKPKLLKIGQIDNSANWQRNCQITLYSMLNLLDPKTSFLPLRVFSGGWQMPLNHCDMNLRYLGAQLVRENLFMYAEPAKLMVYNKKEYATTHVDECAPHQVATLIIQLPTICNGGNLVFFNYEPLKQAPRDRMSFVLFDAKHPYRISTVLSGKRVFIFYKVFRPAR